MKKYNNKAQTKVGEIFAFPCHTEAFAKSRSIYKKEQDRYFANAQYDKEISQYDKVIDCHDSSLFSKSLESRNDEVNSTFARNNKNTTSNFSNDNSAFPRHLKRSEVSKNSAFCHTEGVQASEVSLNNKDRDISRSLSRAFAQYDNAMDNRDISGFALNMTNGSSKPKYDKDSAFPRHCENRSSDSWQSTQKQHNSQDNANSIDCRDSAFAESRNDEVNSAFTCNDGFTHPQTPSARERVYFGLHSAREGTFNPTQTKPKPKSLSLSLATATALAGVTSLNILVAGQCVSVKHSTAANTTQNRVECTGSFTPYEFQNKLETAAKPVSQGGLFYIGTRNTSTSISAGNATINLGSMGTAQYDYSFQFYNVDAPNTNLTFAGTGTGTGTATNQVGILMPYAGRDEAHNANASSFLSVTIDTNVNYTSNGVQNVYGGKGMGFLIHSGTQIGRVDEKSGTYLGGVTINSGKTINAMAIYGGFAGSDRSSFISQITNNGTITELNLGWKEFAGDFASVLGKYKIEGNGTITTLNVYQSTLTLDSNPSAWNSHTHTQNTHSEHISATNIGTVGEIGAGAMRINIGEGVTDANNTFLYNKLIISNGTSNTPTGVTPNFSHLSAGLGTALHDMGNGFRVSPDIATSYGANIWRTLTLSYARRSIMLQNILDSIQKKNFRSTSYDKNMQKAKGDIFSKDKVTGEIKYAPSMRKLAGAGAKQKRQTKVEEKFLPYSSNKTHIAFFVPYAVNSLADAGISNVIEWGGGMLMGVQKDLKVAGIVGVYAAYEYAHITSTILETSAITQTNSVNVGATYFKVIPLNLKNKRQVREGYLKANLRSSYEIPMLEAQSPLPNIKFKLESNTKASSLPFMWSIGAELRGGWTFYQYKSGGYLSPEFGISYDVLSPIDMKLQKAKYKLGGNEYYPAQFWHLPQLGASLKYYKIWNDRFKTSFVGGLRYNILNKPQAKFKIGGLEGSGHIYLPILYGNFDMDFIWILKKNHELSAGYNGIFFSNFNFLDKEYDKAKNKFNGMSNALNIKYTMWFGGEW